MTWACHHPEHTSLDCVSDSHMADNGGTKGELAMLSQSSHFKVSPKPPGEKNKEPGGGENWGAGFQSDCAWDWQPLRRKQRRKESRRKGLASIPPPPQLILGPQHRAGGQASGPASTVLLYPAPVATVLWHTAWAFLGALVPTSPFLTVK